MLQGDATFCNACNIAASPPGTATESPLAHALGVDLPTKIVADHLSGRITDLEIALAEQGASAVVEGLVFVDGANKLPAAVAGVRTLAASTSGSVPRFFRLTASAAFAATNNHVIGACFAVDGTPDSSSRQRSTASASGRVESMTVLGLVLLNPGQYVELWVTDETGSGSVTITDLQVTVAAIAG